ncbi:MAG: diacylglycerol kinase family protein [Lachnospiraceae bacterium]|nr:diacylglycerol kinase family protein [Lachnospiraceae bacterium]
MEQYFIIYNPLAGNGDGKLAADSIEVVLDSVVGMADITRITNYRAFLADKTEYILIICGGDGTLNRFINDTEGLHISNRIFYYAIGTGNDFLRDIDCSGYVTPVEITTYTKNLPVCEVNNKKYRFINGVGYGIDGYCNEEGNKLREKSDQKVNYTKIAVKGLLRHYKPTGADVTVDGMKQRFEKVWLAPTMFGRYYGGGMMPTPEQNRRAAEQLTSLFVFHGSGKLKTLIIFPQIVSGKHIKYTKYVSLIKGKEIIVEFDNPRPMHIDGETIGNVKKYAVHAGI